jgi:hypothetical protein
MLPRTRTFRSSFVYDAAVTPAEILTELEKLALRLGVPVRYEPFGAASGAGGGTGATATGRRKDPQGPRLRGGLCRLRGQLLIVVDREAPLLDKIGVLSEALARFDLEAIFVPPALRARLDTKNGRRRRRGPVAPTLRGPAKAVRRVYASQE